MWAKSLDLTVNSVCSHAAFGCASWPGAVMPGGVAAAAAAAAAHGSGFPVFGCGPWLGGLHESVLGGGCGGCSVGAALQPAVGAVVGGCSVG
eukprot:11216313-Heterocapsa_arctica.AAC.1